MAVGSYSQKRSPLFEPLPYPCKSNIRYTAAHRVLKREVQNVSEAGIEVAEMLKEDVYATRLEILKQRIVTTVQDLGLDKWTLSEKCTE